VPPAATRQVPRLGPVAELTTPHEQAHAINLLACGVLKTPANIGAAQAYLRDGSPGKKARPSRLKRTLGTGSP
jgi:hypothetical protein